MDRGACGGVRKKKEKQQAAGADHFHFIALRLRAVTWANKRFIFVGYLWGSLQDAAANRQGTQAVRKRPKEGGKPR